jgi:hypothetical protein
LDQELKNQCGIPLWISNSIFCCLYWIIMSIECSPPFYELWCLPVLSVPLFITTTNDDGHYQNRIENGMKHFRVTLILGHVILKQRLDIILFLVWKGLVIPLLTSLSLYWLCVLKIFWLTWNMSIGFQLTPY